MQMSYLFEKNQFKSQNFKHVSIIDFEYFKQIEKFVSWREEFELNHVSSDLTCFYKKCINCTLVFILTCMYPGQFSIT